MTKENKKTYDFGEKTKEKYKTKDGLEELEVWQSPKFLLSKKKAIELIEDTKYSLDTGDFWILKNKAGDKLMYTGLIISHNGCLKINDRLDKELKFNPSCVNILKDEGDKIKVMNYVCQEQGVYEFGEISPNNCKNDYPYAMVLKRLMDRVILKNSKVGFFGIYSEAESDDFKEKEEPKEKAPKTPLQNLAEGCAEEMKEVQRKANVVAFNTIKKALEQSKSLEEVEATKTGNKKDIAKLAKYAPDLFELLSKSRDSVVKQLESARKMAAELGDDNDYRAAE